MAHFYSCLGFSFSVFMLDYTNYKPCEFDLSQSINAFEWDG